MQARRALIVAIPPREWNYHGEGAAPCPDGCSSFAVGEMRVRVEGDSPALRPVSPDGSIREVSLDRYRRCLAAAENGGDPWAKTGAAPDAATPTSKADVSNPRTDAARPAGRDGESAPRGGRRAKRRKATS